MRLKHTQTLGINDQWTCGISSIEYGDSLYGYWRIAQFCFTPEAAHYHHSLQRNQKEIHNPMANRTTLLHKHWSQLVQQSYAIAHLYWLYKIVVIVLSIFNLNFFACMDRKKQCECHVCWPVVGCNIWSWAAGWVKMCIDCNNVLACLGFAMWCNSYSYIQAWARNFLPPMNLFYAAQTVCLLQSIWRQVIQGVVFTPWPKLYSWLDKLE